MQVRGGGASYRRGVVGEDLVCSWLRRRGFNILFRNYRSHRGEIDVIAEHGRVVVFIEVKTRSSGRGRGAAAVTADKRRRLVKTALAWLSQHAWARQRPCRFDVIEVQVQSTQAVIHHLPGAFDWED